MKQGRLLLVGVLLIGMMMGDAILIDLLITRAQAGSSAINMAGRQRMLSQKMTKEVLLSLLGDDQSTAFQQTRQQFRINLNALIIGGTDINFPANTSSEVVDQLKAVESVWQDFDRKIMLLGSDTSLAALSAVSDSSVQLMEEANLVVSLLEQESYRSLIWLRMVIMGFLLMTVVAAIYSYYELRHYLVGRLQEFENLAVKAVHIQMIKLRSSV